MKRATQRCSQQRDVPPYNKLSVIFSFFFFLLKCSLYNIQQIVINGIKAVGNFLTTFCIQKFDKKMHLLYDESDKMLNLKKISNARPKLN